MSLERLVAPLEICQAIKDAGGEQGKSVLVWARAKGLNGNWDNWYVVVRSHIPNDIIGVIELLDAPTCGEFGEMIPMESRRTPGNEYYGARLSEEGVFFGTAYCFHEREVEARAQLVLARLKERR